MAAAAVTGSEEGRLGTAVYLLASLFNHSCIPNVDVTFPHNNSKQRKLNPIDALHMPRLCAVLSRLPAQNRVLLLMQTCQCAQAGHSQHDLS